MYAIIMLATAIIILFIRILFKYEPNFDLIESNHKFTLLLWYNKYDNNKKKRVYIKLF